MTLQIFVYNTELYLTQSNFPMIEITDDLIKQLIVAPSYNYNNLPFFQFNYTGLSDTSRQYLLNLPCDSFLIEDNITILCSLQVNNNSGGRFGFIEYLEKYNLNP